MILNLPNRNELRVILGTLSLRERAFFYFVVLLLVGSLGTLLFKWNARFLIEIPARGGVLEEGIVGIPRFVNPVIAISEADKDLVALVFSGLVRAENQGGFIGDLAESVNLSDDNRVYTFTLRDNLSWHDGKPLTSEDVVFTVNVLQDKLIKSPREANWEGIIVEAPDARTVRFTLKEPYTPFLENASVGILPKHLWQNATPEGFNFSVYNVNAIGSGPYMIKAVKVTGGGVPREIELTAFDNFALGYPLIDTIRLKFYANEEELMDKYRRGEISGASALSPLHALASEKSGARIMQAPLSRIFAVFFNQNQKAIFTDPSLRKVLARSVDQEAIIESVLGGYGTKISGPIPEYLFSSHADIATDTVASLPHAEKIAKARETLLATGWTWNEEKSVFEKKIQGELLPLKFSIATSNATELKQVAELIQETWSELGAQVDIHVFEIGDLNQTVIRPRKYDVLLFGEVIGRFPDPYAFWHSSQRLDPGLNIASYTNITADRALEKASATAILADREKFYRDFISEVEKDIPAVFLYSPNLTYLVPNNLHGISLGPLGGSSDRFANVHQWYLRTETVWKIFSNPPHIRQPLSIN